MKKGFTLIELLVVVLIIGILAAIAVPQYQKAVMKSKATQLQTLLAATVKASNLYYMNNGEYPESFDELDIDIPFSVSNGDHTSVCADDLVATSTKGNSEIEISLYSTGVAKRYYVGAFFKTGKYKCTGFIHLLKTGRGEDLDGRTFCAEGFYNRSCGTNCEKGAFCHEVMGLKWHDYDDTLDRYQ